ncbi:MAG: hypothetical protein ABI467_01080 [Kofleriaceae bacterium]
MTADDLARELGLDERPAWLDRVPEELGVVIAALRERRRLELRETIDHAMEQVPWLLRGALKKVLFP